MGHAWTMIYVNKKWINADTVIKEGKLRGQDIWINPEEYNRTIITNFPKLNYDCHKNKKLSNIWYLISELILYYPSGIVKDVRYYK